MKDKNETSVREVKPPDTGKTDAERAHEFFVKPRFGITTSLGGGRIRRDIISWGELIAGYNARIIAPGTNVEVSGSHHRTADQLVHSYQDYLEKERRSWHQKPATPAQRAPATVKSLLERLQRVKVLDVEISKIIAALAEAESDVKRHELGAADIDVLGLTDADASARHTAVQRQALVRELGPARLDNLKAQKVEAELELGDEIRAFSPSFRNYVQGLQKQAVDEFCHAHGAEFSEANAMEAATLTIKFIELEELLHTGRIESLDANNQEQIAERFIGGWRAAEAFENKQTKKSSK